MCHLSWSHPSGGDRLPWRACGVTGGSDSVSPVGSLAGRLALYVYEYLLHVGAQKSAQTFLSERFLGSVLRCSGPPGDLRAFQRGQSLP
uniref:LisH domain-containing protein n=1 Tax=Catharus ustulatus TaxID=91951 RepID=A0A8C3U7Q8_CATUS